MKKTKRFLAVVLCMLLMLTPLAVVAETVTVQAAEPQTVKVKLDKKTGKRYGYDENNQKVTQQWGVTAKGFRYYFGKNGAAYQADQDMVGKYGILMKKINGKYYGFDVSGHTVKGIRVGSVSMYEVPKLYYFNPKTGAVDKKKTSLYRKYAATSTVLLYCSSTFTRSSSQPSVSLPLSFSVISKLALYRLSNPRFWHTPFKV